MPSRMAGAHRIAALTALALLTGAPVEAPPAVAAPGGMTRADLTFTIATSTRFPISRFIYGVNFLTDTGAAGRAPWFGASPPAGATLNRLGGNRFSAYNWETNYSNAGHDYRYQNDNFLSPSTKPGEAVRWRGAATFARGAAMLVTVPMIGYVAADDTGVPLDTTDSTRARRLATHFHVSKAAKGGPFSTTPDARDPFVYQDEFIHWLNVTFPFAASDARRRLFYSLDNEPDLWTSTHREIESNWNDNPDTPRIQTYSGFIDTTIAYARAIKAAAPNAVIFGPAVATYTGVLTLGRYPRPDPDYGKQPFIEVYLDRLRQAERQSGVRLVDVLDVHWYPAPGTRAGSILNDWAPQDSAMITTRLQAPRSLWDPTYDERSWVTSTVGGPVRLLPRLREIIQAHYPDTKIAITEYFYGRSGDISGGIAQADVLGIFGREGVFAATLWPQAGIWAPGYKGNGVKAYAYAFGAFAMYLDYDGRGSRFGDTGVQATTSDPATSSVYASADSAGRLVVVAINKLAVARSVRITLSPAPALSAVKAWAMTDGTPSPVREPDPIVTGGQVTYTMPPMSVSTLAISP
ncbi:MAG TPA: glycoside hydrolase family 44 protein [Gemmatimonadaceae bacterium]|nr:glycoside hydrolase family 44 protein [Gemmatimonadaceae bacterium]